MDWASGFSVQSSLLGEDRPDAFLRAQSIHAVFPGDDPAPWEFVDGETVPEGGIVGVDVESGVDQMCMIPITLCQRSFASLVESLGGEPKHPAGHRDGHTVIGKVEDQRVHHLG